MENSKPIPQTGDCANATANVGAMNIQPREEARTAAETPQQSYEPIAAEPTPNQPGMGAAVSVSDPSEEAARILDGVRRGEDIPAADPWAARAVVDEPTLDGLSKFATDLITELCEARQVPVEFYLAPIIAAVGAAAGGKVRVKGYGYTNNLNTAVAVIAPSGSNKSTPGREIMQPLEDINEQLRKQYEAELKAYNDKVAAAAKSAAPVAATPPKKRYIIIKNATEEARKQVLADNPHGVLQYNDELATFITNQGKYTKSNETGEMLSILDGMGISDARKTGVDIYAKKVLFSVFGTIQPNTALKFLTTETNYDNGLASRFLIFQPTRVDISKRGRGSVEEPLKHWGEWVRFIYHLPGEWELTPDPGALPVYDQFFDESAQLWNRARSDAQRSVISKLKISVWKLAGVAHLISEASEPKKQTSTLITANEMRWAVDVCKYVYRKHLEMIEQNDMGSEVKAADVVRMILRFNPDIEQTEIARLLGLKPGAVRQIKYRMTPKK